MTNEPRAGGGLDPEMLAAYIDKRLPPDERAIVEARLAADPDSYELLVELIHANEALKDETPKDGESGAPADRVEPQARTGAVVPMVPKPKRKGSWLIAGGVLAAAAALVLAVRLQPDLLQRMRGGEAVDPQLAKLVEAVGEERYIEARLTGGFKYGPLRQVTRGPGALSQQNLALLAAAREAQALAQDHPTIELLHAGAVALLLTGEAAGAVELLIRAAALPGAGADVLSDLAAAYASRAVISGHAEDWDLAFRAASRAVELSDTPLPEALFNRALAASKRDLASSAPYWRDYIAAESNAEWRELGQAQLDLSSPSGRN